MLNIISWIFNSGIAIGYVMYILSFHVGNEYQELPKWYKKLLVMLISFYCGLGLSILVLYNK